MSLPTIAVVAALRGAAWRSAHQRATTGTREAASLWSLLEHIGELTDEPHAVTDVERMTAIRELLHSAGIHHGQCDDTGLPVLPPHTPDCRICADMQLRRHAAGRG